MKLLKGDCLELLEEIPDGSIDMVCCDMPYGTTNCRWDTTLDLQRLWKHYRRVTKENAAIVLFAQTPFDKVLGCSNLPWLRYELVWEKTHQTGHLNAKKMPMKAHENILVFYNKLPTYNPQKTSGHVRKSAVKRRDETPVYGEQNFIELPYDSTERYPRSVLTFPSDKQRSALHPTQKPLALIEWLIATYTNAGDTVLDNCMGSGTTGVACRNLDREFIGIELDDFYFKTASQRICDMTSYYQSRPCDINAYRDQTEKGYSSGGYNMFRRCHVCGAKGAQGYKKVKGTGGSRHSPTLWRCPSCEQRSEQTAHQAA